MDVTIFNLSGVAASCHCGARATFVWTGWDGKLNHTCDAHNPMSLTTALPLNFTGHTICPACGK